MLNEDATVMNDDATILNDGATIYLYNERIKKPCYSQIAQKSTEPLCFKIGLN